MGENRNDASQFVAYFIKRCYAFIIMIKLFYIFKLELIY